MYLGGTGPVSDTGWGCMLRCGQMILAQALICRHLGRGTCSFLSLFYNTGYIYEVMQCFINSSSFLTILFLGKSFNYIYIYVMTTLTIFMQYITRVIYFVPVLYVYL